MDAKAYLAYVVVCLVWGSTYLANRIGVSELPTSVVAGSRFFLAGVIMLAYVYLRKHELPRWPGDYKVIAVVGLALLFGGNGLLVWSLQYISAGLSAVIFCTVPFFVAILEFLLPGGSRLVFKGWAGLLLGFLGVGVLIFPGWSLQAVDPRGVAGTLAASLLWAAGSLYSARNPVSGSTLAFSALQSLLAGTAFLLTGLLFIGPDLFNLTTRGAAAIFYLIFAGSFLGYSCFLYILKVMPPAKAITYTYVNPLVAVVLGWLILDEAITLREIAAAFFILAGVLLVQTSRLRSKQRPMEAVKAESKI